LKKRWFLLALILLTVVNLSALSAMVYRRWCAHCDRQACCAAMKGEKTLQEKLDLTPGQSASMETLHAKFKAAAKVRAVAMEKEQIALTQEMMKAEPDSTAVTAILKRISDSQAELQRQSVDHLLAQKIILSPGQQQKLFALVLHSCAMNPGECINQKDKP